ncbi:serine hydrolase domain-containing protein [Paraburkholderia agricolaris]|uniref:serine hydrolase domain-containing protein n=1 Tax=Paraburkholderia agricolaris TaxID=2152888 RepID=UPI0012910552|nr:serine hydrolase domain-containing protein [Paraburkholderia agricolaris]
MAVSELVSAFDELFLPFNRSDAPGLTVGIAQHGKLLYRRGFGLASLEHAEANMPTTRFRIGSTSKHFTSLLALLLAEDGKLDLDAPTRRYIPELTGPSGEPTLRQLLQHRGGSRCHVDVGFLAHGLAIASRGNALAMQVRQTSRNFAPGRAMIYNNSGYHLVSIAIERANRAPFEEQLKQRLFGPVGMVDTAPIPSDSIIVPGTILGEIAIGLDEAVQGKGLTVRFGGQSTVYGKVSKDTADVEVFATASAGQYYSGDAECTAVIIKDGKNLMLRCDDPYGQIESELICLGETVARGAYPLWGGYTSLSFSGQDGQITEFQLNSMRTRGLTFKRKLAS